MDDSRRTGSVSSRLYGRESRVPLMISGARYSGVPQKLNVLSLYFIPFLDRPKSVILICPSASSSTFSGFRSL